MLNLSLVGILFCSFFLPGDCSYYDYYYSQYSGPRSYGSYLFPVGALQKKGPKQTTDPEYSTEGLAPWADTLTGPCANLRCSCLEHSDCDSCKDIEQFGSGCLKNGGEDKGEDRVHL